jgi:hypothetical protein
VPSRPAGAPLSSAGSYDPSTRRWSRTGGPAIAPLPGGRALIVGGGGSNYGCSGDLVSAELYDPTTGRWTPAASMSTTRAEHTATLLHDGRVLVAGGRMGCQPNGGEMYNPTTGT